MHLTKILFRALESANDLTPFLAMVLELNPDLIGSHLRGIPTSLRLRQVALGAFECLKALLMFFERMTRPRQVDSLPVHPQNVLPMPALLFGRIESCARGVEIRLAALEFRLLL